MGRADERRKLHETHGWIAGPHVDGAHLRNRIDGDDVLGHGHGRQYRAVEFANLEFDRGAVEYRVDALTRPDIGNRAAVEAQHCLATFEPADQVGRTVREYAGKAHLVVLDPPAEAEALVLAFAEELLVSRERPDRAEQIQRSARRFLRPVGLRHQPHKFFGRRIVGNVEIGRKQVVPQVPGIQIVEHKLLLPVVTALTRLHETIPVGPAAAAGRQ